MVSSHGRPLGRPGHVLQQHLHREIHHFTAKYTTSSRNTPQHLAPRTHNHRCSASPNRLDANHSHDRFLPESTRCSDKTDLLTQTGQQYTASEKPPAGFLDLPIYHDRANLIRQGFSSYRVFTNLLFLPRFRSVPANRTSTGLGNRGANPHRPAPRRHASNAVQRSSRLRTGDLCLDGRRRRPVPQIAKVNRLSAASTPPSAENANTPGVLAVAGDLPLSTICRAPSHQSHSLRIGQKFGTASAC